MKTYYLFFAFIIGFGSLRAGPAEDEVNRSRERRDAIALLRQGKWVESRQTLAATVPSGGGSQDMAPGRQWVRIAFYLHARGEKSLARQAGNEAIAFAETAARATSISSERASFLTNAGLICDRIFRSPSQARSFYDAAVIAQPQSQHPGQMQRVANDKIKKRAAGKNTGS